MGMKPEVKPEPVLWRWEHKVGETTYKAGITKSGPKTFDYELFGLGPKTTIITTGVGKSCAEAIRALNEEWKKFEL